MRPPDVARRGRRVAAALAAAIAVALAATAARAEEPRPSRSRTRASTCRATTRPSTTPRSSSRGGKVRRRSGRPSPSRRTRGSSTRHGKIVTAGLHRRGHRRRRGRGRRGAERQRRPTRAGRGSIDATGAAHGRRRTTRARLLVPVARAGGVTSVVVAPRAGILAGQSAFVDLAGDTQAEAVVRPVARAVRPRRRGDGAGRVGTRGGLWHDAPRGARRRPLLRDAQGAVRRERHAARSRSAAPSSRRSSPSSAASSRSSSRRSARATSRRRSASPTSSSSSSSCAGASEAWLMARRDREGARCPSSSTRWRTCPARFDRLHSRSDNAALLAAAGVPVVLSTFSSHQARLALAARGQRRAPRHGPRRGHPRRDRSAGRRVRPQGIRAARAGRRRQRRRLERRPAADRARGSSTCSCTGSEQPLETRQTLLLQRYRTLPFLHDGTR